MKEIVKVKVYFFGDEIKVNVREMKIEKETPKQYHIGDDMNLDKIKIEEFGKLLPTNNYDLEKQFVRIAYVNKEDVESIVKEAKLEAIKHFKKTIAIATESLSLFENFEYKA